MKKLFVSLAAIFACLLSFNLSAQECTGVSIDWDALTMYQKGTFYYAGKDPVIYLEFYQEGNENGLKVTEGTYDLGTGDNKNYKTCTECVRVLEDYVEPASDEESGHYDHQYFQKSGTIKIDTVDKQGNIKGSLSAKLVEVTLDSSYNSTPVTGGGCLEIESATFDSGVCVPDCTDKICGNDGCGGTCGDGCGIDLACSADQKSCVPWECDTLAPGEVTLEKQSSLFGINYFYQASASTGDASLEDFLRLQFYNEGLETGTINLSEGENANYATCTECFLYLEDIDGDGYPAKIYFQQSGKLVFDTLGTRNYESKGHADFRLVEVEIDDDYNSIPVTGGKCYEVKNMTWDTICVPKCEGKICGDDGCGGTCGDGCGDKMCSADQKSCVDWNCTKISINKDPAIDEDYIDYGIYFYTFDHTPAASDDDYTSLQFYDVIDAGEHDLANMNYYDCDICLQLFEGAEYDEDGYLAGYDKRFFQHSGNLNVTSFDETTGNIKAKLSKVKLVEVTIDAEYYSAEVPGGKCYEIEIASFAYGETLDDDTDADDTDNSDTDDSGSGNDSTDTDNGSSDAGDTEPAEEEEAPAKKKKSGGCSLVTL